jgi:hypothetical protein
MTNVLHANHSSGPYTVGLSAIAWSLLAGCMPSTNEFADVD